MANNSTHKKLLEKYGVTGKYANINNKGEQTKSASSTKATTKENTKNNVKIDTSTPQGKLLEKYGVTGKYANKNVEMPKTNTENTTKKYTDFGDVAKPKNANKDLSNNEARLEALKSELSAKKIKYTDDYWQSVYDDAMSRFRAEGRGDEPNTATRAWLMVDGLRDSWEKEKEELEKEIRRLSGVRDATWKDATIGSLKRGYEQSRFGEETYKQMMGNENNADAINDILQDEQYQFEADGFIKEAVSGAAEIIGQMGYLYTKPETYPKIGSAMLMGAGTAAAAGQMGPQIGLPEEIATVPAGALLGLKVGMGTVTAENALKVEAGHAYNEMIEHGISHETARNIALGVGTVNATLEMLQVDELVDAFKILNKSGATSTVAERIFKELVDRGVDVAKETAQEVAQEGVTMGGTEIAHRIDKDEGLYTSEDVKERLGDVTKSSVLSFGMMNIPATAFNVATNPVKKAIGDKQQQYEQQKENLDAIIDDEEKLNKLIEIGKQSGVVASKFAKDVEQAKEQGKTSREQVRKLINVVNTHYNQPDSLEQAARDVVESRNKTNGIELLERRKKGQVTEEILNTLSENNEPITKDEVKKVTGFGDNGAELIAKYSNEDGATFSKVLTEVKSSYTTGLQQPDIDINNVSDAFISKAQQNAFTAGQMDGKMLSLAQKEGAKNVAAHKDAGFDSTNLPNDVVESEAQTVDLMAKALGVKSFMTSGLKGNAEINRVTGEVPIDVNFEREIVVDGKPQKVSLVFHAAHEMAVHRVVELAPEEGRAFVYAMYNALAGNEPSTYTLADAKRSDYARQGVNISFAEAMEEVTANNILRLYDNDINKFHNAIDSIVNGNDTKAKQGLRKYIDYLNKMIRKILNFLSGKSAQEKANMQPQLDEITKLRDMFETAFRKATHNVKAKTDTNSTKNLEIKINEEYNGSISHSLYGYPRLSKSEWALLNNRLEIELRNSNNFIDEYTKWLYANKNGTRVFAIYGIGWGDDATPLYAVGGKKAENAYNKMLKFMEEENETFDGSREDFESWVSTYTATKGATSNNISNDGNRGRSAENGSVYSKQQTSNGKRTDDGSTENNNEISHSLKQKDQEYLKVVENGDTDTIAKLVEEVAEKSFPNSKVRGDDGKLKLVYHGRVSEFTVFDRNFANIEGDFGKGYYFTSNEYDVDENYANEEGADLQNKIARLAERLGWEDEYSDLSYEEREEIAKERLIKSEPNTITAYLNIENPVYITPNEQGTFLDFNESYDEEYDEYGEPEGLFVDFIEALNDNAREYATYKEVDFNFLYEHTYDDGGMFASDVVGVIKRNIVDELTDENGDLAINEIIRQSFEDIGFDGIIDTSVYYKFNNMNGMDSGTTHYIVFNSNQIKSADYVTYDDNGNVIPLSERFNKENEDIRYSLKQSINESMTMDEAKTMLEKAFVIGEIKEYYDGEYKTADEWLRGVGASEVAIYIENEYTLVEKYLNKLQGYLDGDFYVEDILDAYLEGTLVGREKPKAKRLDIGKNYRINDERFYSPKQIKDAQSLLSVAMQRVTNENRKEVTNARAKILLFAHNKGASELLGLSQTELNKKLRTWSGYSAKARDISTRFNNGVADSNKWTGIENCSWLVKSQVTEAELESLVKEIKGSSNQYERNYIARTMLALDTHIDWTELIFDFKRGYTDETRKSVRGLYNNSKRTITIGGNSGMNTVAHEMGHALDYKWHRDLFGKQTGVEHCLSENPYRLDLIEDTDAQQFVKNFNLFIDSLTDVSVNYSAYTMESKETFARFVAKFVEWVEQVAGGRGFHETDYYGDKFTASQYIEFVKLLQEKAMLDSKKGENKSYSLKGTNHTNYKDHQDLVNTIEHLKNEFKVTKFAKADPKKLETMTKKLLKEYSSQAEFGEIFSSIDELYGYIANGEDGHPAVWDEVYRRAYNVSQNILDNAVAVYDELYKEYKDLREYLRSVPMKFDTKYDELPSGYESFNEFRRSNFGRLNFRKDGTSIDGVYQELSSLYPEFFDSSRETDTSAQLDKIIETLDSLQPTEYNPYSDDMKLAASFLANDIIDNFFDIPQAKPTFADKAEQRVVDARISGNKKVERVRQNRDEKIQKLMASQRAKIKNLIEKSKQSKEKAVDKEKAKRKATLDRMSETKKASVIRAKIIRHTGELNKTLLKATDKKHIPPELENAVLTLLYNINMESNYSYDVKTHSYKKNNEGLPTNKTKAFQQLKAVYEGIAKNNDYGLTIASELYDATNEGVGNIFDELMKLSDKKIADMTSEELTKVYDAIRLVEHSIATANKMFAMQKWENLTQTGKAFEKSVATRRPMPSVFNKRGTLDIETPITFFSHFGEAGMELYQALRDSQDNEQKMIDTLAEHIQGIVSLEQVQKAEKELFEFTTASGEKLTLSKAHIMDIYLLYNRNQGKKHLLYDPESEHFGNGIHQPEIKSKHIRRGTESTRLTKGDLGNILSKLTEEDKAIANKMQNATLLLAEWGNKACMEVFGYEKFKDPNYWTIKSAQESINQTLEKNKDIARAIKNMGSAKPIEDKATNALDIGGVFNVFNQHASDMISYSAWLGVMEDATKLYNYTFRDDDGFKTNKTFKGMLDKYAGNGGNKYYFNLLKDIQNGIGIAPDTSIENYYTKLFGMAAKAKVAFKLTVVAQQPMAIVRAADVLNPVSIAKAIGKGGLNLPAWAASKVKNISTKDSGKLLNEWYGGWERALKYSPIAKRKSIGGYEINSNSSGLKDVLYKPDTMKGKVIDTAKESPLWAAGKADQITWGILWNACEIETDKNTSFEKGSEAYYEDVNKLFTKVINETQVVDGVLQRSQMMRSSSGWVKPLTAFKGEPTMALNGVLRAYDNLRYETNPTKRGKAIKKFSRATTVFVMSAIFTAFARSLAVGVTGEDDEEYWKKVWKSFSGVQGDEETWFDFVKNIGLKSDAVNNVNPLSWLPVTSELMSFAQGYDVERLDVASIGDFLQAGKNFVDSLDDDGKYKVSYATRNLLFKLAELTGYSPYNLVRDIEGAIRTVRNETDDVKGLYDMEKWRTKPASNQSVYIDILHKAYTTDKESYEEIYNDLIENGVDAEKIKSGMETRMKKAEGVEKSSDLSKRYMAPGDEKKYDSSLKKIENSSAWKSANTEEKESAKADLYDFLTSTSEAMEKTRKEARAYGVDETEYTLMQLAKEMVNDSKVSMNAKEKAEAIKMLDLGNSELAYFYNTETSEKAYANGVDIENFAMFKAAVSGLKGDNKKSMVDSYAKKYARNTKEYLFFMGTEYSSYKKRRDYISYFGK